MSSEIFPLTNYYIKGPILTGQEFIMVCSDSGEPLFLDYSNKLGVYVLRSTRTSNFKTINLKIQETMSFTSDNKKYVGEIVIKDLTTESETYLGINQNGFLTRVTEKMVFKLKANINPWYISPILTGVRYSLFDINDQEVKIHKLIYDHYDYGQYDYTAENYQTHIRFVPLKLYQRIVISDIDTNIVKCRKFCNRRISNTQCLKKVQALETNWILRNIDNNQKLPKNPRFFTNTLDCRQGDWYIYCTKNKYCGDVLADKELIIKYYDQIDYNLDIQGRGTCRGPCQEGDGNLNICDLNNRSGIYECQSLEPFSQDSGFWVIIIIIALLAIVFTFLLIFLYHI